MNTHLKYLLITCTAFLSISLYAQQPPKIKINWERKEAFINDHKIQANTPVSELRALLGNETRVLSQPEDPTRLYIYDSLGINFIIDTVEGLIKKFDVYCSKGRMEFQTSPKKLFAGEIMMNGLRINPADSIENIRKSTNMPFEEISPARYWYLASKDDFNVCIAYTNKKKEAIGMIYVLFQTLEN